MLVNDRNYVFGGKQMYSLWEKTLAGHAEKTKKEYINDIECFRKYVNYPLSTVTRDDVLHFIDFCLNERKLKPATVARRLSGGIKSFFRFCKNTGAIEFDPTVGIKVEVEKHSLKILSPQKINEIIILEDDKRLSLMVMILFSCWL